MSNFFYKEVKTRYKKYLFKNKKELSKRTKKEKERGWGTLIGLILVLIQLICIQVTLFNMFKLIFFH